MAKKTALPKVKKIQASKYIWKQVMHGNANLLRLVALVKGKDVTGEVEVDVTTDAENIRDDIGCRFSRYGQGEIAYIEAGVEFTDGTVMVCASLRAFGGTFQSHDNITTEYFLLTPR